MTTNSPPSFSKTDEDHMKTALGLAAKALGLVAPNPAVGCVLVKAGKAIGAAATGAGGRPHAEFLALKSAGEGAQGATAYVTLEPCAHQGATPSCARLLAEAGVKRVVYATEDPDPRTCGKGAEILKKAGISVARGLLEKEAKRLNRGFILAKTENRPLVTLKIAASADGKIAANEGTRTRITGREAQAFSHRLRAANDAILVGIGTVLTDDPDLTCRLPGFEDASPARIVLDSKLRIPANSRLLKSAGAKPVWAVTEAKEIPQHLRHKGVEIIRVDDIRNIKELLETINKNGITRLLVEGGATVTAGFLESGLVDDILWLTNPGLTLGPRGVPAVRGKNWAKAADIEGFKITETVALSDDRLEILSRMD